MEKLSLHKTPEIRDKSYLSDHERALGEIESHLRSGWVESCCSSCNDIYYQKASKNTDTCGTFECEDGYAFIESKPARKGYVSPFAVHDTFSNFFDKNGYEHESSLPLTGYARHTIFTGTAGQMFDEPIFEEAPFESVPKYISQPVIRMQQRQHDGFMKSFVNISLEQLGATESDHLKSYEKYLDFMSELGIYAGDLRVKVYEDEPDWGNGKFKSAVLGVYYDGLEVGVLNYFTGIPQSSRQDLCMSDVSFGLERMAWALNRNPRFIDVAGPETELLRETPHSQLDAYRTITLMMQSGIKPENKSQEGEKLKKLFGDLPALDPNRYDLIKYYYQWWEKFNECIATEKEVLTTWERESARRLKNTLDIADPNVDTTNPNSLVSSIVTSGIMRARNMRGAARDGK